MATAWPLDSFLRSGVPRRGRFDMPYVKNQPVRLDDLGLIRYPSITQGATDHLDATVHFFEKDQRFDEVWNDPDGHLAELAQYSQVLTPDFSLYADTPLSAQFINIFRSRWCGWYWQQHGMTVIPTVSWSTPRSFEFCFDGLPTQAVLAVSTIGLRDAESNFMAGYTHMCRRCTPSQVICYGRPFNAMMDLVPLVVVPYVRNARLAPRAN
jgi:hypothetical protein